MGIRLVVLMGLLASLTASAFANSIPTRGKSNYGESSTDVPEGVVVTGSAVSYGSFTVEVVCPFSEFGGGSCESGNSLIDVITPGTLAGGTEIYVTGVGALNNSSNIFTGLYCAGSFVGDCEGGTLAGSEAGCIFNESFDQTAAGGLGVDTITVPSASSTCAESSGTQLSLLFADPEDGAIPSNFDVSLTPSTTATTPEPGSLVLLSTGVLALAGMARRRIGI